MNNVVKLTEFQLSCELAIVKRLVDLGINDVSKTIDALKDNSLPGGTGYFIRFDRVKPTVTVWVYDDEGMISVGGHEYLYEAIDYPDEHARILVLVDSAVRCLIGQLPKDEGTASIVLYPPGTKIVSDTN